MSRRSRRIASSALGLLACFTLPVGLASATAQGPGGPSLKSIVDGAVVELAQRQQADGSYDHDVVTTASAVLAFVEAPRRYAESDGPFLRRANVWLASQVGADGRPRGAADVVDIHEAVALAGWIEQALATSKTEEAKAALARLAAFRASDAVKQRGDAKMPDAEFLRTFKLPGTDAESVRKTLDTITSTLASDASIHPADTARWFETLPAICADLAARFPDLKLPTTTGEDVHWSKIMAALVLRQTQAPAGFEEAPARRLAVAARALTICHEKAPKEAAAPGGAPPKPTGTPRTFGANLNAAYREAATDALAWLATQQQDGRFGFMGHADPGITALALSATLRTCRRLGTEPPKWVAPGLDWLVALQKKNGAIHDGGLAVYVTSAAVFALADAGRPQDAPVIEKASRYLSVVQRDDADGYDPASDWGYGGIGYGDDVRPDLSNTQFGIEALHVAGVPADDAAMQRAILFLQRCQNDPEFNTRPIERADGRVVRSGNDGGANYHPGESKAGLVDQGDGTFTPRSYGSMTYALLKCYLFAGLPKEDPRVQSALRWIGEHWTVEQNPGFDPKTSAGAEHQGLFYYYFTMGKALDASGIDTITTPDGKAHAWRDELLRKLLELSFKEGFWTNQKSSRWMEEFPTLATSYALVAMDSCLGKTPPGR